MKSVIALLLMIPATAWATDSEAPSQPSRPIPTGIPHTCLEYYPSIAMSRGDEGLTTIRFTIKEDGTIGDAWVQTSSGSDLLDQATLDCAKAWTYKPAMRDGKAVAVSWAVRVEWYMHHTYEGPAPDQAPPAPDSHWSPPAAPPEDDHSCAISFNSGTNNTLAEPTKPTVVQFTITPEGSTRDPLIASSSGSAAHDAYAIGCVVGWHYVPAKRNGKPVSAHWSATMPWRDSTH